MKKSRILIVEDDRRIAEALAGNLRHLGYEVVGTATTGEDAIELAEHAVPDLVLMDIKLPGKMDGVEAASVLNSSLNVPVIFTTGHGNAGLIERAKMTEPFGYLMKPYSQEELRGSIEIALYKAEMAEQLHERQERLKDFLDNANDLIQLVDLHGALIFANRTWRETLGYSEEEIAGLSFWDILHPDSVSHCEEVLQRVLAGESVSEVDLVFVTKEGVSVLVEGNVNCRYEGGKPVHTRGIFRDVTERKKAEEALSKSEERYRQIVENANDSMCTMDERGRFTFLNQVALHRTGYSESDLLGKRSLDVVHPDYRQEVARFYRAQLARRIPHTYLELPIVTKTGETIWIGQNVLLLTQDHRIVGFQSIARDITDRKKVEEELMRARELWELSFDAVPDLMMILDKSGRVVQANRATLERLGLPMEKVAGTLCYQLFHGRDTRPHFCPHAQLLEDGCEHEAELHEPHLKGTFHVTVSPIRDSEGELALTVHVARDITERKRYEDRLNQLVEEMKQFGYIVSHDLKAPLGTLTGFSTELEKAVEMLVPAVMAGLETLPDDQREKISSAVTRDLPESLEFIRASTVRMAKLVEGLLKVSRAGHSELSFGPFSVNEICKETLNTLRYQINQRAIEVAVGELPDTVGDRGAMEQIFANLIDNAIKYLDPNRPGRIAISGWSEGDRNVFQIRDNGVGVAPSQQERIFQIFRRADSVGVAGDGLGLACVRSLVRRHGGEIWCESEPGVGSTFTFTIATAPR